MKKITTFLILFFVATSISAQRKCGTYKMLQKMKDSIPGYAAHHQETMDFIRNPQTAQYAFKNRSTKATVVTIPVVFHILYKTTAENVSDSQIMSQLTVLNTDYRKQNVDFSKVVPTVFQVMASDMEIQYCLATKTPTGASTSGIVRKAFPSTAVFEDSYYTSTGDKAWDPTKYLNIWVGNFKDTQLLGFAFFPTSAGMANDGLCIGYQAFGTTGTASSPFNKGRTAVHEIGHYFGLDHPWGDDGSACGTAANDDGCADTPATKSSYSGCPTFPNNTYACTSSTNGSMFMNYMDYVNDACMAMFSNDQKTIVRNTLSTSRLSLITSNTGCTLGIDDIEIVNKIAIYPNPVSQYFTITSTQINIDEVEIFDINGQLVKNQKLNDTNSEVNIENLATGTYFLRIYNKGELIKSDKMIKK